MFDWLFENFAIAKPDTRPGAGITMLKDKSLGLTAGDERPMQIYPEDDIDDYEEIFVDDASLDAVSKHHNQVYSIDPKRSDVGLGSLRLTLERDSKNLITKGISPRLTYRKAKIKGPAFGAQGNASYIKNRPGRLSGTQYGTSRAPIDDEFDDPLMFGEEPKDSMELSFLKQQKKIKKIHKLAKSLENKKKRGYLDYEKHMYKRTKKRR